MDIAQIIKENKMTQEIINLSNQVIADYKQIQMEVHQRNLFFNTVKSCQEICARYILPDSTVTAEDAMTELVEILDNQDLIKEMSK
jgi:hypothetical protein